MPQAPTCMDDFDPNARTVEQALAHIQSVVEPIAATERVGLREALGRVLAEDLVSTLDIPPHANSAMDGYALRAADLAAHTQLRVAGDSLAGHPFLGTVGEGECVYITTGAVMPRGADTVVMQEHAPRDGDLIRIEGAHRPGQNVRLPGEDIHKGDTVLSRGRRLNAADLGLLASLGMAEITVTRRPIAAFFSTGDELKGIGQHLGPGEIYDSNRYTLKAMLTRLGVDSIDMGVISDTPEAVAAAFQDATQRADLIITSGGVSVGAADFIQRTLERIGQVDFWKIAMKPGRPLAFGRLGGAYFFGLPGNPVSTMATFGLFVRPAVQRLLGEHAPPPLRLRAISKNPLKKRPGRTDFQRGILRQGDTGELQVETSGLQGSHVLSSMSRANCFIVLPLEAGDIEAGTEVDVIPFEQLF